jgi:hypothetical protein
MEAIPSLYESGALRAVLYCQQIRTDTGLKKQIQSTHPKHTPLAGSAKG